MIRVATILQCFDRLLANRLAGHSHRITLCSQRRRCVLTSWTLFAASQVLPPPVGTRRQKYGMSAGKPDNGLYDKPRPHKRSVVAVKQSRATAIRGRP